MAPLPVIADTFRCAVRSQITAGYAYNVFHVRSDTLNEEQIADELQTRIPNGDSPWTNLMATVAQTTQLAVTPLDGSSASTLRTITGGAGVITGHALTQVAALVSLRTPLRGPANRGRMYIPFIGEGAVNEGFINGTEVTGAQAGMDSWVEDAALAGITLVVASYTNAEAHTVTSSIVEAAVATQRRRQDRIRAS